MKGLRKNIQLKERVKSTARYIGGYDTKSKSVTNGIYTSE